MQQSSCVISQGPTDSPAMRAGLAAGTNPEPIRPIRLIPYDLPLRRDGLRVRMVLPEFLTTDDADRLVRIVESLVMVP